MSEFALKTALPQYLRAEQEKIQSHRRGEEGLDFFPIVFEMLTYQQMNEIAAYGGFPNRYPHWRFGMEYEQLAKSYEYGLSKIYEMVINNNPSYAYLLEGNSLTDQKLVMSPRVRPRRLLQEQLLLPIDRSRHRRAHRQSRGSPRPITTRIAAGSTRWRTTDRASGVTSARIGINKVEEFIDHVPVAGEPHRSARAVPRSDEPEVRSGCGGEDDRDPATQVEGLHGVTSSIPAEYLEEQRKKIQDEKEKAKKFPERRGARCPPCS